MKLTIIIPVGPGHEDIYQRAVMSCELAMRNPNVFTEVRVRTVFDLRGKHGRSKSRNMGMNAYGDSDWYFFLDADDQMFPLALSAFKAQAHAIFGEVMLEKSHQTRLERQRLKNSYPDNWAMLVSNPVVGSLSMGAFFRASMAREISFHEGLDRAEDWEFYLAFAAKYTFIKLREPLCIIGNTQPSAGGPRGYKRIRWCEEVQPYVDYWKKRGRKPMTREERVAMAKEIEDEKRRSRDSEHGGEVRLGVHKKTGPGSRGTSEDPA